MRALALLLAFCGSAFAQQSDTVIKMSFTPQNATVATLPACNAGTTGFVYRVTDALTPALNVTVVGGGAVAVIVRCSGAAWLVGE